tara:strand:- start:613 stop:2160 length:1548 start_codon:yes stop_codon:yes gene_type:complete
MQSNTVFMTANTPLVLLILDGWGHCDDSTYNAIHSANTPTWDKWWQTMPHALLDASGVQVGLPDQQMGNSEVGHMHIGAGRMIHQDLTYINEAIASHEFFKHPLLVNTLTTLSQDACLHVMGLLSDGGVHSHQDHLFAFLKLCHQLGYYNVYLHLFLDGRDTPPKSALNSIELLEKMLIKYPVARIASISGRFYAMDRDQRWERTQATYQVLTEKLKAPPFKDAVTALNSFYEQGITDEFIPPTRITLKPITDNDAVFFFNFRADRARQLTKAFLDNSFTYFARPQKLCLSHFISMTQYADSLATEVVFPPRILSNTLGEVLAKHKLRQLRAAETEKYAHVTFFFNGGIDTPFAHEQRCLIPSPLVKTYDMCPEMSAITLTDALIKAIKARQYEVIICNFANADMVGHTGNFSATIKAIECLDKCMKRLWQTLKPLGGALMITADHGNAETMFNPISAQAHTAHTSKPVPFLYVGNNWQIAHTHGSLIDIAPTVLTVLGLTIPAQMTGKSLLVKN